MITPEEKVLDICSRHGPSTQEEILRFCNATATDDVAAYEQAIERLLYEGKLYRAYENRYRGIGDPGDPANNSLVFLTEEWHEKCKGNTAYTF